MAISDNLKRGTIELTILTLLQDGDMYGYEISQQLSDRSGGLYRILESSFQNTVKTAASGKFVIPVALSLG